MKILPVSAISAERFTLSNAEAVATVDQAISRLLDGLAARHIDANIVVVSDHGMAPVSGERVIRMQG